MNTTTTPDNNDPVAQLEATWVQLERLKKRREREQCQQRERTEQLYTTQIKPYLDACYLYFCRLTKTINELAKTVRGVTDDPLLRNLLNQAQIKVPVDANYYLIGMAAIDGYLTNFEVNRHSDSFGSNKNKANVDFTFQCHCVPHPPLTNTLLRYVEFRDVVDIRTRSLIDEEFKKFGLSFEVTEDRVSDTSRQVKMNFKIKPIIPIRIDFIGNVEDNQPKIEVTIYNGRGSQKNGKLSLEKFFLFPNQISKDFLGELVLYLLKQPSKLYTLVGEKNIQLLAEGIQLYGNKGNHATNRTPTSTVASKSDINQVLAGIEKLQVKTEKLSSSVTQANKQSKIYQQAVTDEVQRLEKEVKRNTQTHLGILGMLLNMIFGKKRYHR